MTLARTCIAALTLAACSAPGQIRSTSTAPTTYRLCSDPQFESMCTPASLELPAAEPIRVDTNLKTLPVAKRTAQLG